MARRSRVNGPDLFAAAAAREARDRALAQVKANAGPWFGLALAAVEALPSDWVGMGEDLRLVIIAKLGKPHSVKVWGSLVREAIKHGWLVKTGVRAAMQTERSHARMTDVYRRGL